MNFNSIHSFLTNVYTKTFGSIKNNMSKFFFLRFFFERNNKNRVPFTKFNYIFHNLKWKNMMTSTINFSLSHLWFVSVFLIMLITFIISTNTNILFDYAKDSRNFSSVYVFCRGVYNDAQTLSLIGFAFLNALVRKYFPKEYNLFIDFLFNEGSITPHEDLVPTKKKMENYDELSKKYISAFIRSVSLPSTQGENSNKSPYNNSWLYNSELSNPQVIGFLADIELSQIDEISSKIEIFTSNKNFQTSYLMSKNTIENQSMNLNNYNFSEIISVLKTDRWLFKNSLLGNNSVYQLNLLNQMHTSYNNFFSSNQWLIKKYFFNNQLKNNLYIFSDLNSLSLQNTYNYGLYNYKSLSLREALSPLNSIYYTGGQSIKSLDNNSNLNRFLSSNALDLYTGDNLLFLVKMTSNQFYSKSAPFYTPLYQLDFKSPSLTFKVKK